MDIKANQMLKEQITTMQVRKMSNLIITLIFILIITIVLNAQNYLWPTNASQYLTSSFGEFRPRHFHAAIDIKTWNQTGYKIFAIEDGRIFRLRVSAQGYGKAIYLKLKDGNIVVYGHLEKFTPALEQFADSLRLAAQNNTLDTYLTSNQFTVKRGEHLGYTGETGIGVPHLHFEIRDSKNRPINPLQFYSNVIKDNIPPLPSSLAVIPLNATSLVNFKPDTLIMNLPRNSNVNISEPIYVTGKVVLALKAYDQANGVNNLFSFYAGSLFVNDSLIYKVQYDRFSYANTRMVELDKNFSLWRKGVGVFHQFFRHEYNSLSLYGGFKQKSGILSNATLKEGTNQIIIELSDYYGNSSHINLPIVYHPKSTLSIFDISELTNSFLIGIKSKRAFENLVAEYFDQNRKLDEKIDNYKLMRLRKIADTYFYTVNIPAPKSNNASTLKITAITENNAPFLPLYLPFKVNSLKNPSNIGSSKIKFQGEWIAMTGTNGSSLLPEDILQPQYIYQLDPQTTYSLFRIAQLSYFQNEDDEKSNNSISQMINSQKLIIPSKSGSISSPDNLVQINFIRESVYDTTYCNIEIENDPGQFSRQPKEYPYLSPIYDAQPFDLSINHSATLVFKLPDTLQQKSGVGVYYLDRKKGWIFLPTNLNITKNQYQSQITSLEKFVLIKDTISPQIIPISRLESSLITVNTGPIKFQVKDEMSGIYKQAQINVYIDDQWSLFEFDPEEDLVTIPNRFLSQGVHTIKVVAKDNMGNNITKIYKFRK
jgi:hypothetical protein